MFTKVLIANRGAIACRIIRTLNKMNIASVVIYSDADAQSLHVQQATQAINLPGNKAADTYLNADLIIDIAKETGAQAIHPGYGFLSENVDFANACEANDIVFLGPTSEQISQFGLKHCARELAVANNVPVIPGSELITDKETAVSIAQTIGYPVMLKSTAGGGGIGMQVCEDETVLTQAYDQVKRLSQNNFGNDGIFLEKYIGDARHIEIQVLGDGHGNVITLGDRDCTLQRRNQKVIEEAPAPDLTDETRANMKAAALSLTQAVNYRSAGTIEFIYDKHTQDFYFLEVNTRLQVEHGVTEMITGIDLVEQMIRIGAGDTAIIDAYEHKPQGHAIQARLYAEDAGNNFQPSSGLLTQVTLTEFPQNIASFRCDGWIETGIEVPPFYDPMLAKLITHADNREHAMQALAEYTQRCEVSGIATNLSYINQILNDDAVKDIAYNTRYLNTFLYQGTEIEVLEGGTQTTVQDLPGRVGYWDVGVPPSGPMDELSFALGNRLLENDSHAAGLECTLQGPTLKFRSDTRIVLTGAATQAMLNDEPVPFNTIINILQGDILKVGKTTGHGLRTYLCVQGGIQVPLYLGSASTFTLGKFGGHAGRQLQFGDILPIAAFHAADFPESVTTTLPEAVVPTHQTHWEIDVIYGPHGAPDFFTPEDIETFFTTQWEVHFNSSRTGVRLNGPKPEWARQDGGEAGLHPSNIHDNAYAIGAVDFTGDMPVILGPDGPSLGGFVCPVTITKADLWKMGQLHPGDKITFRPVAYDAAVEAYRQQQTMLKTLSAPATQTLDVLPIESLTPIVKTFAASDDLPEVVCRVSGDDNLLIELGEMVLDLTLRFKVHALMTWIQSQKIEGILDLTPGIRSLQVHFDPLILSQATLLNTLEIGLTQLSHCSDMEIPARIVHLPLSWDDEATRLAIEKYQTTVRPNAPWCPSNIEFIRRINGLESIQAVKDIVFDANYLVMGLGDVYLGAPVATPLDPRHRLVTTKYNPARTWTPENAVGIGGAYMCVYGMEGPGGYQFVGRTSQMWNAHRKTQAFEKPWLLRFFDQIKFYEVSHDELMDIRRKTPIGQFAPKIEETSFSLKDYQNFLVENDTSIKAFKARQQQSFDEEREHWIAQGLHKFESDADTLDGSQTQLAADEEGANAPIPGSVWQLSCKVGQAVKEGDVVAVLESMKTEFTIAAPCDGVVSQLFVNEGDQVNSGDTVVAISTAITAESQSEDLEPDLI